MQNSMLETNASIEKPDISAPIVDITAPGVAKIIAKRVATEIDSYCEKAYYDGHRKHLGASLIGRECKRFLWYGFRHVLTLDFGGRKLRLFNRGHREEERFIEWLRGIGFTVWTHDESQPMKEDGTYPQFRIVGSGGHFGGSLDGIAAFPPSWGIKEHVLLEFKTNGTGPSFNKLLEKGMAIEKLEHFAQTSTYGSDEKFKFRYVLYMNINKNDDDIHIELTKLDWNLGAQMRIKADHIITSQTPPPRLSDNPTYFKCKGCDYFGICHEKQVAEINCRSCKHAVPIDGAQWLCTLPAHIDGRGAIPDEVIATGCPMHDDITIEYQIGT